MSSVWRRSALATLVFFAFTTPMGVAAHLVSELAGLGWHDDADVIFSARHGYLAAIAAASIAALVTALIAVPRGDRKAYVASLIEALPCKGRGAGFLAIAFLAQFAFFGVTQIGEGCPLCAGDILVGVMAAAIAAALGAIAVALGQRRFLDCALALVSFLGTVSVDGSRQTDAARARGPRARAARRTAFSYRYRPPPHVTA